MAKENFGCGREECGASTGIDGSTTFGTGKLDDSGYWEHLCEICRQTFGQKEIKYPIYGGQPFHVYL